MNCNQPDMIAPLANGMSPREIYDTCMAGLEQFEISYESKIDRIRYFIEDQIKIENPADDNYVRLVFMKYNVDDGDSHCDIEIELKIGPVFLSALLSPNYLDSDIVMDTVEESFDKCCELIGRKFNGSESVCRIPISPDSPLISAN